MPFRPPRALNVVSDSICFNLRTQPRPDQKRAATDGIVFDPIHSEIAVAAHTCSPVLRRSAHFTGGSIRARSVDGITNVRWVLERKGLLKTNESSEDNGV